MTFSISNPFRTLSGFDWHPEPQNRIINYILQDLQKPPPNPFNAARFIDNALDLIECEPDGTAKTKLILILGKKISGMQDLYPDRDLSFFYDRISLTLAQANHPTATQALQQLGLDIMRRDDRPPAGLFQEIAQSLTQTGNRLKNNIMALKLDRDEYPEATYVRKSRLLLATMEQMSQHHPDLIDQTYVALCCEWIGLPFPHKVPSVQAKDAPHIQSRKKRMARDYETLSVAVDDVHDQVGLSLIMVVNAIEYQQIHQTARELFTPESLKSLNRAQALNLRKVNANRIDAIMHDIHKKSVLHVDSSFFEPKRQSFAPTSGRLHPK